jgi:hypothetical protein
MYCLTRYEMKFGDIVIPARTKCDVVNKLQTETVDAPGVHVTMIVHNCEADINHIKNENEVIKFHSNVNNSTLCGLAISTNTQAVYMDAGDRLYYEKGLYDWQLEKIFGIEKIPEGLLLGKYKYNGKDAKLHDVIEYLEEEFTEWVQSNCEFYSLDEDDIENGEGLEDSQPEDMVLSDKGIKIFYEKQLEYQKRLETTGFTYEFNGGLIWE